MGDLQGCIDVLGILLEMVVVIHVSNIIDFKDCSKLTLDSLTQLTTLHRDANKCARGDVAENVRTYVQDT